MQACVTVLALALLGPSDPSAPSAGPVARSGVVDPSAALEAIRTVEDVPGLAAIGIKDGSVVVLGACGRRRADDPTPLTAHDRFHLGSCGKAMTATMIATLVEDDTLRWDLTIGDALPELHDRIHANFQPVTLLELLQHRGGIAERKNEKLGGLLMTTLARLQGSSREQRALAVPIVLSGPPTTEPGKSMEYSNYGYMTAAAMAEAETDESWQQLMTERVFRPLHMQSAGFDLPGTKGAIDEPRGHQRNQGRWVAQEPGVDPDLPECIAPAGLIHCTLEDWAKFVQAHLDGERGSGGLVSAETFRLLHRPPGTAPSGYACGWGVATRDWSKGPLYTHSGSNGAWYSIIWAAPSLNAATMAVCNAAGPEAEKAVSEAATAILRLMGFPPESTTTAK